MCRIVLVVGILNSLGIFELLLRLSGDQCLGLVLVSLLAVGRLICRLRLPELLNGQVVELLKPKGEEVV